MDSNELEKQREALIAIIARDFADVSRAGGISWSEARAIDNDGTAEEEDAAAATDLDRHWTELVDDEKWDPERMLGGFSFLDAIGFRYYLPAALTRMVRDGSAEIVRYHLSFTYNKSDMWVPSRIASLNTAQRQCIAQCFSFMIALYRQRMESEEDSPAYELQCEWWQEALNSFWIQYL